MKKLTDYFYIITGGPGVGKTSVINELYNYGFQVVSEDAREIIRAQIQSKGEALPWKNKDLYASHMLQASIESYNKTLTNESSVTTFFDRGIPDTICYMNMENIPISKHINNIVKRHIYNPNVFIMPPWKEIYTKDDERKQTWEEAEHTFYKMKEIYLKYNYILHEVPQGTVKQRVRFILNTINY